MTEVIEEPRLLRPTEVSRRLGVSLRTLARWQSERTNFPRSFRIGDNTVVFDGRAVEAWINQQARVANKVNQSNREAAA